MRPEVVVVALLCLSGCGNAQRPFLKSCQRSQFSFDVVVAYGIAPIRNAFPHNLFKNGRTPNAVSEFTRVLLTQFDFRVTKMALVSFNQQFRSITGFTNNRNRLWRAFERWEPRPGAPVTKTAIDEIRAMFSTRERPDSRRLLILLADRKSAQEEQPQTQAAFARSEGIEIMTIGYGETYRYSDEIRAVSGSAKNTFTVSNPYFLAGLIRYVKDSICKFLKEISPTPPPPPPPIAPVVTTAANIQTTTVSPIIDEIVVLADDSDSTRDFAGIEYFYNRDSVGFLDSLVTNVDYSQCRVAIYLFSSDTRGLVGGLTSNQSTLHSAVNNIQPTENGFGTTNTADAISRAALTLSSSGIPSSNKYIILLTDGQPDDFREARDAVMAARGAGIKIGIVLAPLFDGQISYRTSDMSQLVDLEAGDDLKVVSSRSSLPSAIPSNFCPVAGRIFDSSQKI